MFIELLNSSLFNQVKINLVFLDADFWGETFIKVIFKQKNWWKLPVVGEMGYCLN